MRLGRRDFLGSALLLAGPRRARAASSPIRIGLVLSDSPTSAAILQGAEMGLAEATHLLKMFDKTIEIVRRRAKGPQEARHVGEQLLKGRRVAALVGGADDASAEALSQAAEKGSGLFFNVGSISSRLPLAACASRTFHVQAGVDARVAAVGLWLLDQQKKRRFGLIANASPFGEEVAESLSRLLEARGGVLALKETLATPAAEMPALVGRLRDAGADVAFLAVKGPELAAVGRAAREAGLELAAVAPEPGAIYEASRAGVGAVWPVTWHHSLEKYSGRELNARFRRRFNEGLGEASWAGWAAVKLAAEGAVRAEATTASALLAYVEGLALDGHKGTALTFRKTDHELGQPLYVVRDRKTEGRAEEGGLEVLAEISRERLDAVAGATGPCGS